MEILGVKEEECHKKERSEFEKKGLDPDVIDLRFRHAQGRLMDNINKITE